MAVFRKLIFDDASVPSAKGPKFNHLSGGKEASRRITVLNSLFIKHISDLLMTGNTSAHVLDKGLEITRVSRSDNPTEVNLIFGNISIITFALLIATHWWIR